MGEVFAGRYELIDPLGEGGMASVWRVWDERKQRVVAAKVLRQSDAVSLLRFVREQAVRVSNPHVLTPIGWAGEDDRVLFTMPIVDGGSVATLVGDFGPLPPPLVEELLRQVLTALEAVHAAGILHRDVKPANLLLATTGTARPHLFLTDFGIAIDLGGPRFTQAGAFTGTPGYLAPELEQGAPPHATADLYAVGQVALLMLCGQRVEGGTAPCRPAGVSVDLWHLVADLTAPNPGSRPQSAGEARNRLGLPGPWDPAGLADVEVFCHVPVNPYAGPQLVATESGVVLKIPSSAEVGSPAPSSRARTVPEPDSEARAPTRIRRVSQSAATSPATVRPAKGSLASLPAVLAGALVIAVSLLVWSLWSSGPSGQAGQPPSSVTTTLSSPGTGTPSSPSTPSAVTPSSSPSASPGSVSLGTVVTVVGQPCEFVDVGVKERTLGGVAVVCQRRADGSYAWDPPPP